MRTFLTKNRGLKLISLVLAIVIWYYATGEEGVEVTRTIPLEITVENPGLSLLESSVKNVQVTMLTPRTLLSDIATADIRVQHTIGREIKTAGEYTFRLDEGDVKLPKPRIRVVRIEPEAVSAVIDVMIVQRLPIRPDLTGEPAFGYAVQESGIQLDPNAMMIEGPKARLEKLDFIPTEPIDLVGRIRSFRRTVTLSLPPGVNALGEVLIDAYIPISEENEEKVIEGVKVKLLRAPEGATKVTVEPAMISFTLMGPIRQLDRILEDRLLAFADISALGAGTHEVSVEIMLPEDVRLKEEKAPRVKVTVK